MNEIRVPELGDSITEGTISTWIKKEGDAVEAGDVLVELETDKVNLEINAEYSGVLKDIQKQEGDNVEVGEVIAFIAAGEQATSADAAPAPEVDKSAEETETKAGEDQQQVKPEVTADEQDGPVASPAVRRLAREKGINLEDIAPKDPMGRITSEDVIRASQGGAPSVSKPAAPAPTASAPADAVDPERPVERIRMSRRRQTIAKRLVEAQHTAAMLTTFNEVDMSAIFQLRNRRKDAFLKEHDVKLGFMSFFTKAVVAALKAFPRINAEIQGDEIVLKNFYDIGIAVSAEEGLVVPVVRNADRLSFAGIEREIGALAQKARENTLTLAELQGGTFTITNGGVFGSLLSTPILNTPQVGILGMHTIQTRPVAIDEHRMENRPMMYIALSYDHRIVDGSEAVRFLVKIKNLLEDPESLLLEG